MTSLVLALAIGLLASASPAGAASPYLTGQPAVAAIGQATLTNAGPNGTPGTAASGFALPSNFFDPPGAGAWSDGQSLIVADTNNNRVLVYANVPTGNGFAADLVLGQPDGVSNSPNQGGAPSAATLSGPTGVFSDGIDLYVADTGNSRVLVFQNFFATSFSSLTPDPAADLVLGQQTFSSGAVNGGFASPGANTFSKPTGVFSDRAGNMLYVADAGNSRIAVFNAIPAVSGASADYFIGQSTPTSGRVNRIGVSSAAAANTLNGPFGVYKDTANVYVADTGNNRVLIYNLPVSTSNATANIVVGQVFLTSASANQGGAPAGNKLSAPTGVYSDLPNGALFIADFNNNRVLHFNSIPSTHNAFAAYAIGQSTLTANLANEGLGKPAQFTLKNPVGVIGSAANNYLFITDQKNNRVLVYGNEIPTSNNTSASVVAGQTDFASNGQNQATALPAANALNRPTRVYNDGARFFIVDRGNNRVLLYNSIPTATNASASFVFGQTSMSSGAFNQGIPANLTTLALPNGAYSTGSKLFVADQSNNRVPVYTLPPLSNGASATFVLGGAGAVSATTMKSPGDVFGDGARLYVADTGNNRVLMWTSIPPGPGNAPAVGAIGQTALSSGAANGPGFNVANGAKCLQNPTGVFADVANNALYVADQGNHRVLIYKPIPVAATMAAAATTVLGQANFASNAANRGGPPTANTMNKPTSVYTDGSSIYVADQGNNRVLVFLTTAPASGAAADLVVGQSTFTSGASNLGTGGATANTLSFPASVAVDSATGRMYIADANNNRVLLYKPAAGATIPAGGATLVLTPPTGPGPAQVQVAIPPNAFASPVTLSLTVPESFPIPVSAAASLRGTGEGFQINSPGAQPALAATLALTYRAADVAGLDVSKLVLARYDDLTGVWVPLVSFLDPAGSRVLALTDHFSTFQLMAVDPSANDVNSVRAFPNPLRPSAGQAAMTFALAPPGARLRIYTVTGVLIVDLAADNTGMARWDGTNSAGNKVASGVYVVFVQGNGRSRTLTVAVER